MAAWNQTVASGAASRNRVTSADAMKDECLITMAATLCSRASKSASMMGIVRAATRMAIKENVNERSSRVTKKKSSRDACITNIMTRITSNPDEMAGDDTVSRESIGASSIPIVVNKRKRTENALDIEMRCRLGKSMQRRKRTRTCNGCGAIVEGVEEVVDGAVPPSWDASSGPRSPSNGKTSEAARSEKLGSTARSSSSP